MKKEIKALTIRMDVDNYNTLQILSNQKGEPVAVLTRRIIEEYLAKNSAVEGLDIISTAIRKVIRSELKPTEDRMAKLAAKTAISSATSMFMNYFVVKEAPLGLKISSKEVYEQSRIKAVAYLREKEKETIEDDI